MMQHALASRVQWGSHLSTGDTAIDAQIDAQDQGIFRLIEEIGELWRHRASVARFRAVASKTSRVLEEHFRCEERMLAEVGYPDLSKHAAEHGEMLEDLASIRVYGSSGGEVLSAHAGLRLSNFILGVTVGHIVNTDSAYCQYIADETAKLSTGCS